MKQTGLLSFFILIFILGACRTAGDKKYLLPDRQILEKYWKLTVLSGKELPPQTDGRGREAYLSLKSAEKSVEGSGPCNRMRGDYELYSGNRIRFSALSSTKMLCPMIETERSYFSALERTDHYRIMEDTLIIYNAGDDELARFLLIYMQ